MAKPAALGKGLGALINVRVASPTRQWRRRTGPDDQSHRDFSYAPAAADDFRDEHLQELVDSIKEHGIIQPLICRRNGDKLELIAGERRWRAAQRVGLAEAR
jgi:ParB family chromosome partitioning protein